MSCNNLSVRDIYFGSPRFNFSTLHITIVLHAGLMSDFSFSRMFAHGTLSSSSIRFTRLLRHNDPDRLVSEYNVANADRKNGRYKSVDVILRRDVAAYTVYCFGKTGET